jgi:Cof subfamily protein (haloacid dehalogenase superfamily)
VGIDLDGTLLNSQKIVTKENAKAVEALEKNGIKVTIFTGRNWISGQKYLKNLKNDIPSVFQNGAYIVTSKSNKVLREITLNTSLAQKLVDTARKWRLFPVITEDFLNVPDMKYEGAIPKRTEFTLYFERNAYRIEKVKDLKEAISDKKSVAGVTWVGPLEIVKKAISELDEIKDEMSVIVNTILDKEAFIDFLGKDCGKDIAMNFVLKHFDFSHDEAAFIGDSYNDEAVLKMVSHPIAMGNAPADIQEIAEFVTSTNDENGVANAIYNFILKESDPVD